MRSIDTIPQVDLDSRTLANSCDGRHCSRHRGFSQRPSVFCVISGEVVQRLRFLRVISVGTPRLVVDPPNCRGGLVLLPNIRVLFMRDKEAFIVGSIDSLGCSQATMN